MENKHRMFLQAFMSHGIMKGSDVKKHYEIATKRFENELDIGRLPEFVNTINSNIKDVHMEIKKAVDEDTGVHYYVLVNLEESDITRLSSAYTLTETEYFKKCIEAIVQSDEGILSSMVALNLIDNLEGRKMSKKEAEDLLRRLIQEKWLVEPIDGQLALSTRSIMELDRYIKEQYPDHVSSCNMCKRLAIRGPSCSVCDTKAHKHCAARFFKDQSVKKCPGDQCDAIWDF